MKTGRPKLNSDEKKGQITAIRLRSDERELVEKAASIQNQNLSEWMRGVVILTAKRQTRAKS
jgi:uncharacterized protein (DUF1778 family)